MMMIFFAVIACSGVISLIWLGRVLWVHWWQQRKIARFCAALEQTHPRQTP